MPCSACCEIASPRSSPIVHALRAQPNSTTGAARRGASFQKCKASNVGSGATHLASNKAKKALHDVKGNTGPTAELADRRSQRRTAVRSDGQAMDIGTQGRPPLAVRPMDMRSPWTCGPRAWGRRACGATVMWVDGHVGRRACRGGPYARAVSDDAFVQRAECTRIVAKTRSRWHET